jgi:hypothetical protein
MARWLLAQVTIKVLRRDARLREWFKRVKRRRGASIARVAVMRKLATIIWHMLSKRRTYAECRALAEAGTSEGEQPNCAEAGRRGSATAEESKEEDLALGCQSRMEEGGIVPPHWVLAPGTALGLLPSRALSSAQARGIVVTEEGLSNRTKQRGD